jgi:tetratricopeptide (TPR) repeat protein
LHPKLRQRYVLDIVRDLSLLGGSAFETFGNRIVERLSSEDWEHRGTNLEGSPVAGVVDSLANGGLTVAQYSSEQGYFSGSLTKLRADIEQATQNHTNVKNLWMLSSREMGPTAATEVQQIVDAHARANRTLHVVDARAIANTIVDNLLDEAFIGSLEVQLAFLSRIREEWAASHRVPEYPRYQRRTTDEEAVEAMLTRQRHATVAGVSGVGKSALCGAIAKRARERFELVLWVDASQLGALSELTSHDVLQNGLRQNIQGLIRCREVLLVLDNLRIEVDLNEALKEVHRGSAILANSQFGRGDAYVLGNVDQSVARGILNESVASPCSESEFLEIWSRVGGHPLLLAIVASVAGEEGWPTAIRECTEAVRLEDDSRELVCRRLLRQHISTLGLEISFIAWCGSPRIDAEFLEKACGVGSARKLRKHHFLSASDAAVINIHDLILESVVYLAQEQSQRPQFAQHLAQLLADRAHIDEPKLLRCSILHRRLIERLLTEGETHPAIRYGLAIQWQRGVPVGLLGDPAREAQLLTGKEDGIAVWAILETLEAIYHSVNKAKGDTLGKATLRGLLPVYDVLSSKFEQPLRRDVLHHRGKALRWLGERDQALDCFADLVKSDPEFSAGRLQLARLLAETSETASEALEHLEYILALAEADHSKVTDPVILATFDTLRRGALKAFLPDVLKRRLSLLAKSVESRLSFASEQPLSTIAGIGAAVSYEHPELIPPLVGMIRATEENRASEEEKFALAQLHKVQGKILREQGHSEEAKSEFEQAELLYSELPFADGYRTVQRAENLLLLFRPEKALEQLSFVNEEKREAFWYQREAQALRDLSQFPEALCAVDKALSSSKPNFRATFLHDRWLIRQAKKDPNAADDLNEAIRCCEPGKFLESMLGERDALQVIQAE